MCSSDLFIRDWVWYPSGVTYHSAIIAPLMVLGLVLFENIYFRLLILMDAFLCGSSSAIVGVCVTLLLLFFCGLLEKNKNSKIKRKVILSVMGVISILAAILLFTNALNIMMDKVGYIIIRLFGSSKDSSTNAHLLYYYRYPSIFKNSSVSQNLFGYGYGCSGYIFSVLDNRINIGNWAVESDIMDRLYSLGIVGFVLYYTFLSKILIRGYKIDKKYTIVTLAIIIQGFGYNVQWDYIFLIELVFYICIKNKIRVYQLEVIQDNEKALTLYKKQGFQVDRVLNCYQLTGGIKEPGIYKAWKLEHPEKIQEAQWTIVKDFWTYPPSWQNAKDAVCAIARSFSYTIVKFDGNLIGYGIVDKIKGDIVQLAVHPQYRRMGVATEILLDLSKQTKSLEMKVINVDERDQALNIFLKKMKFRVFVKQYEMRKYFSV